MPCNTSLLVLGAVSCLKIAALTERQESIEKIDGQARCITAEHKQREGNVIADVSYFTVFIPAWSVPPIINRPCSKRTNMNISAQNTQRCTCMHDFESILKDIYVHQPSHAFEYA